MREGLLKGEMVSTVPYEYEYDTRTLQILYGRLLICYRNNIIYFFCFYFYFIKVFSLNFSIAHEDHSILE